MMFQLTLPVPTYPTAATAHAAAPVQVRSVSAQVRAQTRAADALAHPLEAQDAPVR